MINSAKQSIAQQVKEWIASSLALLAMTKNKKKEKQHERPGRSQ
jgi:hypothetical protein